MKNLILGLMITLLSFTAHSTELPNLDTLSKDVKDVATQVDTSQLSKQIYSDVKSVLVGMSQSLKVGAEHVYGVLVKQQIVKSIIGLITVVVLLIMLYIFYKVILLSKWEDSYYNKEEAFNKYATLTIITGVLSFLLLIVVICNIEDTVTGFINPEYGAIKEIISFIK